MNKYRICGLLDPDWEVCFDCMKVLKGFVLGQKKAKEDWDKGIRGGLHYT